MTTKKKKSQGMKLFLMILPFLILCFLFSYFPLHGWIYALYDYKAPLKLSQCQFVGLKWFKTLFSNKTQVMQLIQVMKNTFAMSLLGIATSFLPVLFAVFLNEIKCKWFKNLVQTLTTLPNFISWTLVYSIAFCLFSTTGMFNTVMQNLGVISEPLKILDSGRHVWLQMILWSTWKGLGWGAIMYLAAIAGIDQEMYDAAKVDGAGRFQIIKNITIPSIMPKNLESIHGALLRMNRSIQSEGTFGVLKWDKAYKRLLRRGEKNVILELTLISCGFNLYKYHNKKQRQTKVA